MTAGFVFTQILYLLVDRNVLVRMLDGPATTADIAAVVDAPENRVEMLLRAAESLELIFQGRDHKWHLADLGAVVAGDVGLQQMVLHHDMLYRDLTDAHGILQHKEAPTRTQSFWAYAQAKESSGLTAADTSSYSQLMHHSQAMVAEAVLSAYGFSHHRRLLDIGGSLGTFARLVHAENTYLELGVFDLPSVIAEARSHQASILSTGETDIAYHSGDFFRDPIPADYDCISLVRILCDHDDDKALLLLRNIRKSAPAGTTLLIAEAMNGPVKGQRMAAAYFNLYFLAMGSGRNRSVVEMKQMLETAGFSQFAEHTSATPLIASVVTAKV